LESFEEQVVLFLEGLLKAIDWPGVVIAMTIESACIPLPSEITMPLAGWMLVLEKDLSMVYTLLAGFYGALGCTIGSIITYWVGALGGRPLLERYGKYILISRRDVEMADRWFARWGEETAFFSRLLPIVRTFISFPAGIARMNFAKFSLLTFVGSFIWSLALASAGYALGARWREVRAMMRPLDIPIAILLFLALVWYVRRHLKRGLQ